VGGVIRLPTFFFYICTMRNLLGLMLVTFCLSLLTTSCFAIHDVPKTEKIMFDSKDYHSLDAFDLTDSKIAENRSIEFNYLDERICRFNGYDLKGLNKDQFKDLFIFYKRSFYKSSIDNRSIQNYLYYLFNPSNNWNKNTAIKIIHFVDCPLKVGWNKSQLN